MILLAITVVVKNTGNEIIFFKHFVINILFFFCFFSQNLDTRLPNIYTGIHRPVIGEAEQVVGKYDSGLEQNKQLYCNIMLRIRRCGRSIFLGGAGDGVLL